MLAQRLRQTPSLYRTPPSLRRRLPRPGRSHCHCSCAMPGRLAPLPLGHPAKISTHPLTYWRGLLSKAPAADDGPVPVIILVNGLDSTKEHMYSSRHWEELAARGISCLMLDQPGTGEALRLQELTARIDTEAWTGAAVDWLELRSDVDQSRIGIVGWSLGGYYAPRAAAFEKRLALCVAWGANHNWGRVQRGRLEREGERPVPHYWEHVLWVWGHTDLQTFIEFADDVHLEGVVERITVPFLVAHGANDRQIPLEYAHRSYEQAVNSPKRELRVFTPEEGATEHIGLDHLPYVSTFIADWVADTFAELSR